MKIIGKKRRGNKKIALVVIIIVVALFVCGAAYVALQSVDKPEEAAQAGLEVFAQGVYIMDIDMSGKTKEQGQADVNRAVAEKQELIQTSITAGGQAYPLDAEDLGVSSNAADVVNEAFSYGKVLGSAAQEDAATGRVDFDVTFAYDENAIAAALRGFGDEIDIPAKDATVDVQKSSDEKRELTGTEIVFTEGETGSELDVEATVQALTAKLEAGSFSPVEAVMQSIQPEYSKEELEGLYGVIGSFETDYSDSKPNRRFNIWNMGEKINAVRIDPGEAWSINEQAGPRTNELGWKDAPGITNGELVDQPGGGICQVSSTLYNAVIRAELEIVEKTHHSWRLGYVAGGLDATISTDWPDFQFRNNKDHPVFILVDCDGEGGTIRVSIYGPKPADGVTVGFSSEKIDEFRDQEEQVLEDPTLPAGERKVKKSERIGEVYQVYKHWYDADGEEIKTEPYEKVTYKYSPAIVYVGTMPVASPPAEQPTPSEETPAPEITPPPVEVTPVPEVTPLPTEGIPDTDAPAA